MDLGSVDVVGPTGLSRPYGLVLLGVVLMSMDRLALVDPMGLCS